MAYNFEIDYGRVKLLRTALQLLAQEADESEHHAGYVFHVEGQLEMNHGVEPDSDEELYIDQDYMEEVQSMLSELESLHKEL